MQTLRSGVLNVPPWSVTSPGCRAGSMVGPAVPPSRRAAGASGKALLSAPRRNSATSLATMQPDRGVRERPGAAQIATPLRRRRRSVCCGCSEVKAGRTGIDLAALQAATCAGGGATASSRSLLSTQIVGKTRRKQFRFVAGSAAHCMRSCRQRLPRVRSIAGLGNGEFRAKIGPICACASTADCKPAWTLEIDAPVLLKSGASRQEKESLCNGNGAPAEEHLQHDFSSDFFIRVNAWRIEREHDMNSM